MPDCRELSSRGSRKRDLQLSKWGKELDCSAGSPRLREQGATMGQCSSHSAKGLNFSSQRLILRDETSKQVAEEVSRLRGGARAL